MLDLSPAERLRAVRDARERAQETTCDPTDEGASASGETILPSAFMPRLLYATDVLAEDEPAAIVFDDRGRIAIDAPHDTSPSRRRKHGIGEVLELGELGDRLVCAMFSRAVGNTNSAWKRYTHGARTLARAVSGLGMAARLPADLPRDLFAQCEQWLRGESCVLELGTGTRTALNSARWLVAAVDECAHIDVTPDRFHGRKSDWKMELDGEGMLAPKPVAATVWGDAETERLIKHCSVEVVRKVAGWNQFVDFLETGAVGEGPHDRRELEAARALVAIDPVLPPPSQKLADDEQLTSALLEMGWQIVRHWYDRDEDGAVRPPFVPRCINTMRRIGPDTVPTLSAFRYGQGLSGFVKVGWTAAVQIAYPTALEMAPFAALLAIQSRLNPSPLGRLDDDEFGIVETAGARARGDHEGMAEVPARMRGAPYKGRSHRFYRVDFPVTFEPDDPYPLHEFLKLWTSGIRHEAGRYEGKLFIYLYDLYRTSRVGSFANHDYYWGFPLELEGLCVRAGVPRITPRELRRIGLDIVHDACDGDMVTMKAAGDWRDLKTGELHYFGPPIILRGQESLIWAAKIDARRREYGIEVIGRPRGGDLFSATDGFSCRNPLDGPDEQQPGEICRARGMCAICRNGRLDVADPAWTFAQLVGLAAYIAGRLEGETDPAWIARYAPVLYELLEFWLHLFPDDLVQKARHLPDIEIPELRA